MQPCNLAVFISILACDIAKGKTADEISLLGSVFSQLGDTLETIAAQQELCSPEQTN